MKKYFLFILAILALQSLYLKAQVFERKTLKAGQNWYEFVYYLFPAFTDGIVKIKNGGQATPKMNFNMMLCQMQFIGPHGDTLSFTNPEEIDSIRLNSKSFFYRKFDFEILSGFGSVSLVVSRTVNYNPVKIGAMGFRTQGASIDSYATLTEQNDTKQLILNVDVDMALESTYFLMQKNGEMAIANKSNFLKLFGENKPGIEGYLRTNKINFNKESDLMGLLEFCAKPEPTSSGS